EHQISIHALTGLPSYSTMRVQGSVGNRQLHILIDSAEKVEELLANGNMVQKYQPRVSSNSDQVQLDHPWTCSFVMVLLGCGTSGCICLWFIRAVCGSVVLLYLRTEAVILDSIIGSVVPWFWGCGYRIGDIGIMVSQALFFTSWFAVPCSMVSSFLAPLWGSGFGVVAQVWCLLRLFAYDVVLGLAPWLLLQRPCWIAIVLRYQFCLLVLLFFGIGFCLFGFSLDGKFGCLFGVVVFAQVPTSALYPSMAILRFHCPFMGLTECHDGGGNGITKAYLITYLRDRHSFALKLTPYMLSVVMGLILYHWIHEAYKNVSQAIRDQLNVEAEAVQIILTGIDNDIYSTVDACLNACEMWNAIERNWKRIICTWHNFKREEIDQNDDDNDLAKERELLASLIEKLKCEIDESKNRNKFLETSNMVLIEKLKGSSVVQKSGIQCYNCKEFGHVVRECQKPKRAKGAAYHREKMLLCKQEEARIQLNVEQVDWRDDTDDDELEDQELEAHYMYMAQLQEVPTDAADSGTIFDDEPLEKVLNDDHYNVFAIESAHPEQSKSVHDTYPIKQDAQNVIIDSLDINYDKEEIDQNDDDNELAKERELLTSLIGKLKCEIDECKNRNKFLETSNKVLIEKLKEVELARRNSKEYALQMELECAKVREMKDKLFAHQETISILSKQKEAQIKLYKTQEDKELEKVIELENKVKVLAPDSDEVIRLEKESRSKLSDLIRPFDYDKLNNLYDLFVPQREKFSEQRYFSERSRLSHINVNNGKSKEAFNKQTTLLEKRMDESIPLDKKCLETELSKSKMMSKSFESVQKHAINLELELQQYQEKIKNDKFFKINQTKDFFKEREQYFEIQDLKAQLQDKDIVI
nr:ribonuclease H-like domain-containing protein [Tanacetum cinerariifolium]